MNHLGPEVEHQTRDAEMNKIRNQQYNKIKGQSLRCYLIKIDMLYGIGHTDCVTS